MLTVAWHPSVAGLLAWGAEDGTVGVVDWGPEGAAPSLAAWRRQHAGPVLRVGWRPSVEWGPGEDAAAAAEAAEAERGEAVAASPLLRMFSCGAEGALLEWPPTRQRQLLPVVAATKVILLGIHNTCDPR